MNYLHWNYLLFQIPLAVSVLLVVGSAFGMLGGGADVDFDVDVDVDVDMDVDADADADADAETDGEASASASILSLLGVGKAPLSVLMMAGLMIFGVVGLSVSFALEGVWPEPLFLAAIAAPVATLTSFFGTAAVARLLARAIPATETYAMAHEALIGCLGTTELPVDREFGLVHVTDHTGTLHKLRCRADAAPIGKGARVLVTDFDHESGLFTVDDVRL